MNNDRGQAMNEIERGQQAARVVLEQDSNVRRLRPITRTVFDQDDDGTAQLDWTDEDLATFTTLRVHLLEVSLVERDIRQFGSPMTRRIVADWRSRLTEKSRAAHPSNQIPTDGDPTPGRGTVRASRGGSL
jgi:hypothetical protein